MKTTEQIQTAIDTRHHDESMHVHTQVKAGGWNNHNEEAAHHHSEPDAEAGSQNAQTPHVQSGVTSGGWHNHNESTKRRELD